MFQLGVETHVLGSEVGDAKRCGDTGASENNDIPRVLYQIDGIINAVVMRQFDSLGELPTDRKTEKSVIGLIIVALERGRRLDVKCRQQLLCRDLSCFHGLGAELRWANSAKLLSECNRLLESACI